MSDLHFEPTDPVDLMFQLNVNEFQNTTSLQMILQDAVISERERADYDAQVKRYGEICRGDDYDAGEEILPTRDDVAAVYTFLRKESRVGHTSFPMRRLMGQIRSFDGKAFNYIKLKFIVRILEELQICGVSEPVPDHFLFDIFYSAKTNLEKSSILHRLRSQQRKNNDR